MECGCVSFGVEGVGAAFLFGCGFGFDNGVFTPCGVGDVAAIGQGCGDAHDFPDKGGELTSHGDLHLLSCLAAGGELAPAFMESVLAAPGDLDDLTSVGFGNGFLAGGEFLADFGWQAIVLGAFVEDPAQVAVAAFGDGSLYADSSAAIFAGHESEVGHELAWMGEAVDVTNLGDGDHGGDDLITFEPHEGEHDGLHMPLVEQGLHLHFQSLDAFGCGINALQILLEHDFHGGVRKDELSQVTHVSGAPRGLFTVAVAVSKKEGFELMACAALILHGIGAGAAEVANGFIAFIGDMHSGQFTCTVKAREHAGITTVCFDLVTRSFGRERGGNDITSDAFLLEEACQYEAAGTCFITDPQLLVWLAKLAHELVDAVKGVGDLSIVPDFSLATRLGNGDSNIFGMDIEAQIKYFFAYCFHICGVLVALYSVHPARTSRPSLNMRIGFSRSSPRIQCSQHTTPFSISRAALPTCSCKSGRSHKVSS